MEFGQSSGIGDEGIGVIVPHMVAGHKLWFKWNGHMTIRVFAQLDPKMGDDSVVESFDDNTKEVTAISLGEPIYHLPFLTQFSEVNETIKRWANDQDDWEIRRLYEESGI